MASDVRTTFPASYEQKFETGLVTPPIRRPFQQHNYQQSLLKGHFRDSKRSPSSIDGEDQTLSPAKMQEKHVAQDLESLQTGLASVASSLSLLTETLGSAIAESLRLTETNSPAKPIEELNLVDSKPSINDENQNRTSREVAIAMTTKAKLLLRELKTVKAELRFMKERCSQVEEENRRLRDGMDKGNPDEDDLVRLQLESLLSEKARLAQEKANLARENQFLHEVIEYHQLTLQDVGVPDESLEDAVEMVLGYDDQEPPLHLGEVA